MTLKYLKQRARDSRFQIDISTSFLAATQISVVPSAIRRTHAKYRLVPLSHLLALLIFMTSLDDYNFNLFSYLKEPLATMRFSLP